MRWKYSTIEVFLTCGKFFTQERLGGVVRQYVFFNEIDISLTTELDPLSAELCNY
jgi:hypothetical protein